MAMIENNTVSTLCNQEIDALVSSSPDKKKQTSKEMAFLIAFIAIAGCFDTNVSGIRTKAAELEKCSRSIDRLNDDEKAIHLDIVDITQQTVWVPGYYSSTQGYWTWGKHGGGVWHPDWIPGCWQTVPLTQTQIAQMQAIQMGNQQKQKTLDFYTNDISLTQQSETIQESGITTTTQFASEAYQEGGTDTDAVSSVISALAQMNNK